MSDLFKDIEADKRMQTALYSYIGSIGMWRDRWDDHRGARAVRRRTDGGRTDHSERRLVGALCLFGHAVDTGEADRKRYDQGEAERFARALP